LLTPQLGAWSQGHLDEKKEKVKGWEIKENWHAAPGSQCVGAGRRYGKKAARKELITGLTRGSGLKRGTT